MSFQDWTPVILAKKKRKIHTVVKIKPDNEMCDRAPEKVSHKLSSQIKNARNSKKLTQKELANRCNLSVKVVQKYENGLAIPNNSELNKLRKVLGKLTR